MISMISDTLPNSTSRRFESMFTTLSGFIAPILAQERLAFIDPKAFPLAGAIRWRAEKETETVI